MGATINQLLKDSSHRPWSLPDGFWSYYQEWNNALFLHWKIPEEVLEPLIPRNLTLDLYQGYAWISVVAFKMEKIRPRGFPPFSPVSDFFEINLRTYVSNGSKSGVYFLSIEAGNSISAFIARTLSGLPYGKSAITNTCDANTYIFKSLNTIKGFKLEAAFEIGDPIRNKSGLDSWLTERYCLYLEERGKLFRYDIHHEAWEIRKVDLKFLEVNYRIGNLKITTDLPDNVHYSKGVRVLAWKRNAC